MGRTAVTLIVLFASGAMGCEQSQVVPTAPTPVTAPATSTAPTPVPPTLEGERWNLTMTYTSVSGPVECLSDTRGVTSGRHITVGGRSNFLLTVERSGDDIRLAFYDYGFYANPYERYTGGLEASGLFLASSVTPWAMECGGVRYVYKTDGSLEGRFSDDGSTLIADELFSAQSASGTRVTFRYQWTATRL
jgi:hypothetical protein